MDKINKEIEINSSISIVFSSFIDDFSNWWPKSYTWSNNLLQEIKIGKKINDLCTEIGPFGFKCDWGRIVNIKDNELLHIKWQISPTRVPEPDPDKSSDVIIHFISKEKNITRIELEHSSFKNHGEGYHEYMEGMNSEYGWEFILNSFKKYIEDNKF